MQCPSSNTKGMDVYSHLNHADMWAESFKIDDLINTCPSTVPEVTIKFDNQSEGTSNGLFGYTSSHFDEEIAKPTDKIQRRLAQNREAARKCRLRKKGYVQHLETSRLRLKQLEQELDQTRQQVLCAGGGAANHIGFAGVANSGITAFEMEYRCWVEKNNEQVIELRNALNGQQTDIELQNLVDESMKHWFELFQLKATAAKDDVFYLMSGMWKTTAERFFLWIGGFRPSELLKVLMPQLGPLTENQILEICNLRRSCQQAEDALSQGIDRLQEIVVDTLAAGQMEDGSCVSQITATMDKLGDLVTFLHQADHLRRETLNQMSEILTTHQTAKGLLALGDYLQRLRALSSLWAKRTKEDV